MEQTTETIIHKDGVKTVVYCLKTKQEPLASILILHGMAEHHKRYDTFADYLVAQGFDVYIYNHRGHGTEKSINELGFISPNNGHTLLINDGIDILNYIKEKGRCNKLFLLGHSMGSLVSRCIIQSYGQLHGVILSGTTYPPKLILRFGILLASIIKKTHGPQHPSKLIDQIIFGSKPYKTIRKRTSFDWLTRNDSVVNNYINDPYCGFLCSASFYHDLMSLTLQASTSKLINKTHKKLPIFLIAGETDPVGNMGREVNTLYDHYKKWNYKDITMKLYPECRHELLQELNAGEVMNDISIWLKNKL